MTSRSTSTLLGALAAFSLLAGAGGAALAEPLDQSKNSVVDCIAYQAQRVEGALVVEETTAVEACEAAIRELAGQLAGDGLPPGAAHGRAEDFAREAYREYERNLPPCPLPSV